MSLTTNRPIFWLLLATATAQAIFASLPTLDLWVSALFFDPDHGFWISRLRPLKLLRDILRNSVWLLALPALAMILLIWLRGRPTRLGAKPWIFTSACLALGPGLLVNMLLKDHWGRARPADITYFGGAARFTPAFQITDQCGRNCSFTSGEAASVGMTALVLIVLFWPRASHRARIALTCGLGGTALLASGLRIAMGRHFLSDVVFSWLFCALILTCLYQLMSMRDFIGLTPRDLRADLATLLPRRAVTSTPRNTDTNE